VVSRDSSVGITTRLRGCTAEESGFDSRQGPNQPHIQRVRRVTSPKLKRQGREAVNLVLRLIMEELYLHSPVYLHGGASTCGHKCVHLVPIVLETP
jgi:hypothetical protein